MHLSSLSPPPLLVLTHFGGFPFLSQSGAIASFLAYHFAIAICLMNGPLPNLVYLELSEVCELHLMTEWNPLRMKHNRRQEFIDLIRFPVILNLLFYIPFLLLLLTTHRS